MALRQDIIASSVQHAIVASERPTFFSKLPGYFYVNWLAFERVRADLFADLRVTWAIDEDDYRSSFTKGGKESALQSMGDMGFSGSTFFTTADSKYVVKSVPRHFEHSFFKDDMLVPYVDYMKSSPWSLLIRITDFLECVQHSVGSMLGMAPSHHIVMENILCGQTEDNQSGNNGEDKWESWDLKPMSYFYPERDVAEGVLSSEATKGKLTDDFNEKIILDLDQSEAFKAQLEKDTALLRKCNAVDYSLFLVRIPTLVASATKLAETHSNPTLRSDAPSDATEPPSWRTGIRSADGQYIYRASILDFFWAKHKVHAKAMTTLINSYNLIDRQGPMSVTTTADEYRTRFLNLCSAIIEVPDGGKV